VKVPGPRAGTNTRYRPALQAVGPMITHNALVGAACMQVPQEDAAVAG
jgi:hypothetical protein